MTVASVLVALDVGHAVDKKGVALDSKNVEYITDGSLKYVHFSAEMMLY